MTPKVNHAFTGLPVHRRKLYVACIKDFFFTVLPKLRKNRTKEFVAKYGDIDELGLEGGLEACIALFKDGTLQVQAKDITDYVIIGCFDGKAQLIHDSKE